MPMFSSIDELLEALLEIPSVNPPGKEPLLADFLAPLLAEPDQSGRRAIVKLQPVKDGRSNLVAFWDWGPGPVLLLNTHLDVNNPANQVWLTDPFKPVRRDGRVYARGAADAKGSLAAMLWAIAACRRDPQGLNGRVILTAVMGEESGGEGTLALMEAGGVDADGAVVGEPTGLRVLAANKGTFIRRLVFHGVAAHSGQSHLGTNAITKAARFVVAADRVDRELRRRLHPLVGAPSMTVTLINGGTVQNTVPDRCAVTVDRRLVPGETHEMARVELAEVLASSPDFAGVDIDEIVATFPCESPLGSRIVEVALAAVRSVLGECAEQARPGGFPAGCDMSKLVLLGRIPSVILGPGSLTEAHSPNEWVELDQVIRAAEIYERLIRGFLRSDSSSSIDSADS